MDIKFISCGTEFKNDLRKNHCGKKLSGNQLVAEVKGVFLMAGCDRKADSVTKCLATFRV